jgi:hypothetical protein
MNFIVGKLQSQLHPGIGMKALVLNEFLSVTKERLAHRTHCVHLEQNIYIGVIERRELSQNL